MSRKKDDVAQSGGVGAVWVAFALKAETGVAAIGAAGFADESAVEGDAGVELEAGFRGADGEDATGDGVGEASGLAGGVGAGPREEVEVAVVIE